MSAFKLQTLKQKLWVVVATSFVFRIIMFFGLPDKASISLAPDENGYAVITRDISSLSITESILKLFDDNVLGRTLVIPSSFVMRTGFSDIDSVRIVSMLYGQFSLILIAFFTWKLCQLQEFEKRQQNLIILPLLFYAIWPSRFLWSSLGLRESSIEFFVVLTFLSVYLFYDKRITNKYFLSVGVFSGITSVFMTRVQVGWLLVITLLIYSSFKLTNKKTIFFVPLVLLGMILGHLSTSSFSIVVSSVYTVKEVNTPTKGAKPAQPDTIFEATKMCNGSEKYVVKNESTFECIKIADTKQIASLKNPGKAAIDEIAIIPFKQQVNQIGAATQIRTISCPFNGEKFLGKYACVVWRAPYSTLTFLYRPLPFIDTTSVSSTFAAAENMLWISMFALIVYRFSKVKRIPLLKELAPTLIFFSLYVVGAGSYEGNMGTAFRHKSLVLWVPLLLIFALFWQKDSQTSKPQGNNSQESAV